MNIGAEVAVYASVCSHMGLPLAVPGTESGGNMLQDATDATLLAKHLLWEATDPYAVKNQVTILTGNKYNFEPVFNES